MSDLIDPTLLDVAKDFAGNDKGEEKSSISNSNEEDPSYLDDFEFLGDVPLQVSAELGQIEATIKDILALMEGSVIELDKLAGEPLEILINGRTICRGEVIVINEKYGIRMTDIVNPNEKGNGDFGRRSFKGG